MDDVSDSLSPEVFDGKSWGHIKVGESRKLDKFASKMGSGDGDRVEIGDSGITYSSHLLTAPCCGLIGVGIARKLSARGCSKS